MKIEEFVEDVQKLIDEESSGSAAAEGR
ncbi:unnamed protein product, partial [Allacma fusca]